MISVATALKKILDSFSTLRWEKVALANSLGRVLAENSIARTTSPPFPISAMDGYAVCLDDVLKLPVKLTQIGESAAGRPFFGEICNGQCVRIFTGAKVPKNANAIILQENTIVDDDKVTILETTVNGRWIRPKGLDFSKGETLLREGRVISARDIGLMASMNIPWLKVRRQPKIAIVSTGDEIVMPGEILKMGQIVGSNGLALEAFVTALGGKPINLGIAPDNEDNLRALFSEAIGSDMLVTTGGASVGKYDFLHRVLASEEMKLNFYKVAMRPGKPIIFGKFGALPILGLPGNPVSAGVTATIFLRPAMEKMLGIFHNEYFINATLASSLPKNDERQDYIRGSLKINKEGKKIVAPFSYQDSSMVRRFADADCLIIREPMAKSAEVGEAVRIIELKHSLISI